MNNFDKCPVCRTRKNENQPNPINGKQDVFYVCGNIITHNIDNAEDFEETGVCSNKIDWTTIYVEYGEEFDESAKLVDKRFYGWLELQFYKEIHYVNNWRDEVSFINEKNLNDYFDNKELYVKKIRESNNSVKPIEIPELKNNDNFKINRTIVKQYYREPWVGTFVMEEIEVFKQKDYDVYIFKVINSNDCPDKIGSFVVEEVFKDSKKNRINFYEKEIINKIITL